MGEVTPDVAVARFFERVGRASLKLPTGWFGRPHDNLHELTGIAREGESLVLQLDQRHQLTLTGGLTATETDGTLRLTDFTRATWRWVGWGSAAVPQERHFDGGTVEFVS